MHGKLSLFESQHHKLYKFNSIAVKMATFLVNIWKADSITYLKEVRASNSHEIPEENTASDVPCQICKCFAVH